MAETQKASTGAKSEFWFNDGSALYKAKQVKSFQLPSPSVEQLESTTLESDAKEFVPGDTDFGTFQIKLNLRPGSDTDTKIEAWVAAQTERAYQFNTAERGVLTRMYTGNAVAQEYDHGEVQRSGVMEATLTLRSTGAMTSAAYVAP
jgi:hypothetical protein